MKLSGYMEPMLLFENLGQQPDAFRLPVVNGAGLAQIKEAQKHFGSYEGPTYTLGAVERVSSAKSRHGIKLVPTVSAKTYHEVDGKIHQPYGGSYGVANRH